ncbi:hypothetical protein HYS54_02020 [Candidatus Micrarchaeota archaeon]|nr:hypothetical protein [Candidatus Micrarchaeota archaeon]
MRYPRRETAVGFDLTGGRESVPQRMAEREQLLHRISVLEHEIGYKTGELDRAYELSDKMSQAGFTLTVIGGVVTASSAGLLLPVGGVMVGTGRMLTFSAGTLDFLTGGSRILDGSADARDWTRFLFSPLSIIVYNKAGIIESFRAVSPSAGVNLIQKSIVKKAIKTVGKETAEYLSTELAMQIGEDGLARLRPSRVIEVSGKWGVDRPLEPNLGIGMPIENTPARDRVTYVNGYNGVTLDVSLPLEQRYARQPTESRFVESASYSEIKSPAKSGGLVYYGESRTPIPAQKSAYGPSHGLVTSGDPGNKPPVFTPAQKSGYGPSHGLVSNNGGAFTPAQKWAGPKK